MEELTEERKKEVKEEFLGHLKEVIEKEPEELVSDILEFIKKYTPEERSFITLSMRDEKNELTDRFIQKAAPVVLGEKS